MIKKQFLCTVLLVLVCTLCTWAQQKFLIHEDQVNADMLVQYEETAATLKSYIAEHGGMTYSVAMTNDLHYQYIMPIDNYAALDGLDKVWAGLTEKVGEDKMNAMWAKFDECYDVHKNYVVVLDEELSYYPSGDIMADDGGNYRKWTYIYGHPDQLDKLREVRLKWKELYTKHGIGHGFRVYHGAIGTELGTMLIVDYGTDLGEIALREKQTQAKLGGEGQALWMESIPAVRKIDEVYGQMRPDLSHTAN